MKRAFEVFNFSVSRQKRGPHGCRHPECNETETDYLFIIFPDTEKAERIPYCSKHIRVVANLAADLYQALQKIDEVTR